MLQNTDTTVRDRFQRLTQMACQLCLALTWLLCTQTAAADLVPLGSVWKYWDSGTDPSPDWRSIDFNDRAWPSGPGELGFGDGDERTVLSAAAVASSKPITTYFRHRFNVETVPSEALRFRVRRDAGIVLYLNGNEIFRDNMPAGAVTGTTRASAPAHGPDETQLITRTINPQSLVIGTNVLAAEVHLTNRSAQDLSFDLQLTDNPVVRGPYLQQASSTGIIVRWRTLTQRDAVIRYGTDPAHLDQLVTRSSRSIDHIVELTNLSPATRYYYSVGDSQGEFVRYENQYFDTHPEVGQAAPTQIWVLGDSGTADSNAAAVRSAFTRFNQGAHTDVWLMLGDNAYDFGTDAEYQAAVFDMYPDSLRNTVIWPTLGNHDAHSADSESQSGTYYDVFSLPTQAESGGTASGTEAYYSFDYANIHFISLDSHDTNRSPNGAMATWLENDLAANTQEWIIAFWHHPPYSKGSHDSDSEARLEQMRENFLPILEAHGVDLVLAGHSHSYERSKLIDGHYGRSDTFSDTFVLDDGDGNPTGNGAYVKPVQANSGSVYSVAGSSGQVSDAPLNHPVMITNLIELGSIVINIDGNQLDAVFLNDESRVLDRFRIVHEQQTTAPPKPPVGLTAQLISDNTVQLAWQENTPSGVQYLVERSIDRQSWTSIATLNTNSYTDTELAPGTTYYFRLIARNSVGDSLPSNITSVTTASQNPTILSQIGVAHLDHTRATGPRWTRFNFRTLVSGRHAIRIQWAGGSDMRFTLFRDNQGAAAVRIATVDDHSPATWIGELDSNEQYYLGVWSASGAARVTATLEPLDPAPAPIDVVIGQGQLDADRVEAPRWVRVDFEPLNAGPHIVSVSWGNQAADVRFRVRDSSGASLSPTVRDVNPGQWEGTLEGDMPYYIGLWSTHGATDYTVTLRAQNDL